MKKPIIPLRYKFIIILCVAMFFYFIILSTINEPENIGMVILGFLVLIPAIILIFLYFKDLNSFYDEFYRKYNISYREFKKQKNNFQTEMDSSDSTRIEHQKTDSKTLRDGSLSFQEIVDIINSGNKVYIHAVKSWATFNQFNNSFEYIDIHNGESRSIDFLQAFISGIYNDEITN